MSSPQVSVIIPAYNQANYLGEAIQSVLNQTFLDFELIVVNDASPDNTADVIDQFRDPRLKCILHPENRGLAATRNTGIRASRGEFIAFLDADDIFHPQKLETHIKFLKFHPEIALSYNNRFNFCDKSRAIREFMRPPPTIDLADYVWGFPFGMCDFLVRKEAIVSIGMFDESFSFFGEDLDMICRLTLAGYRFAGVDRALSYRRCYSGRVIKNLENGANAIFRALYQVFNDPRCPERVLARRDIVFAYHYMDWAYYAFAQDETALGQKYIREAIRLNPVSLNGKPSQLVNFVLHHSIADEGIDHEAFLKKIFVQFPSELKHLSQHLDWAISRGYLLKATRAVIWGQSEYESAFFARARNLKTKIDEPFIQLLTYQLLNYENEFGMEAVQKVLKKLVFFLGKVGGWYSRRRLVGSFFVNHAFQNYRKQKYSQVPGSVIRGVLSTPSYITNRGVIAILIRSLANTMAVREHTF